ncbi:hypothetical protein [Streptomyces sp. VN1]|uniref:hypothetical protein n=1 Tax=Streptomyces sp. VN1 TaxID=1821625 RepID=UPI001413E0E6|nr:hypothetical protein [Streptomyces sp. VN1]QIP74711.1 hypothetical protein EZV63_36770 [Streptomyces sp. VN1]
MAKSIEVPVDDEAYEAFAEEAARAGVTVQELAGRVLAQDAGRRRFLAASQRYATEWGPAFDEAFGGRSHPDGAAA